MGSSIIVPCTHRIESHVTRRTLVMTVETQVEVDLIWMNCVKGGMIKKRVTEMSDDKVIWRSKPGAP